MKKKFTTIRCGTLINQVPLILWIMKRTLILFILFFSISASAFSQKITINLGKVTLYEALKKIKSEAKVDFFYSDRELNVDRVVIVDYKNTDVVNIVSNLVGDKFNVQLTNDSIILITPVEPTPAQNTIIVKGVIKNELGELLPGVNIILKGTNYGTTSDIDGNYFANVDENSILVFSYVGYHTQEVQVKGRTKINIVLKQNVKELEQVVITGIVQRNKESFTGTIKSVKGAELRAVGNLNVIQSLKTIDPSFIVFENNTLGSNPNVLPNIEVRGKTSISTSGLKDEFGANPNQPLFILDGFETDLRDIVDLDMNRVESITILKDASSTALYGAKAANGVVVVETVKPVAGELRVTYNSDFRIEMPDLSDYSLMNAEEKLEFERLSGRWTSIFAGVDHQFALDQQYNTILAEVKRGVDTYWLKQPLQIGTSLGHSLFASGGDETITYGVGLDYKKINGVMIGSDRANWGATVSLNYRKNKLNISNKLFVRGYEANESPYGAYSNFAYANPYYRMRDENGIITKFLDTDTNVSGYKDYNVVNPLYNATLNSIDKKNNVKIQNNLRAILTFSDQLRLQANLQLTKGVDTHVKFSPPEHSNFIDTNVFEKGSYTNVRTDNFSYKFNVMATYAAIFKEKNSFTANLRAEIEETDNKRLGIAAVGYPSGTNGNPAFSFSYKPNESPSTALSLYRRVNILGSINYSYDNIYLLDATYRLDGSTTFGNKERFSPFYSVGLGFNLHNALKIDKNVVQKLKLRGSIGSTGNQSFGNSLVTTSVYGFNDGLNIFGQGIMLQTLANENLKWQTTLDKSVGLESSLFNNRLNAEFNVFEKNTDPLVVVVDLPSSTGIYGYPINAGTLNTRGAEIDIRYSPIYNLENELVWSLGYTAIMYDSKYDGFSQTLQSLNENELSSNSLIRFRDGFRPDDIWAVPSLGIDPANGREVFLTKDGTTTYEFDSDNEKVMGNTTPDVEGVISSNLRIKNFSFGLNLRYRLGGDTFNYALYNKVENIDREQVTLNQDRRALYDRWQNVGDVTRFKSISLTSTTQISSRFIQKENILLGESINFAYEFRDSQWVEKLGLSRLRLSAYMNDIFRISTVKVERGIDYPFARAVSFSLNASF